MKPSERDAGEQCAAPARAATGCRRKPHGLDKNDAEPERHEQLVLVRAIVEVADDDALHHGRRRIIDEQRAADHRDDERSGIAVGDLAGIAAEHEHRAVREVEHAERAVDDGQAGMISASSAPSTSPLNTAIRNWPS